MLNQKKRWVLEPHFGCWHRRLCLKLRRLAWQMIAAWWRRCGDCDAFEMWLLSDQKLWVDFLLMCFALFSLLIAFCQHMFPCYDLKQIPAVFTFQTWAITFRQASSLLQAGTDRNMQRGVDKSMVSRWLCCAAHQIYRAIHLTTPRNCSFLGSNPAEMTVEPQAYGRCDGDAQVLTASQWIDLGDQSCYRRCRSMIGMLIPPGGETFTKNFWWPGWVLISPPSAPCWLKAERDSHSVLPSNEVLILQRIFKSRATTLW